MRDLSPDGFGVAATTVDFDSSDVLADGTPSSCIPALPNFISGSGSQSSTILVFGSVRDCWSCFVGRSSHSVSSKNTKFSTTSMATVRISFRQCSLLSKAENPSCVMYMQIVGIRVSYPLGCSSRMSCSGSLREGVTGWSYRLEL